MARVPGGKPSKPIEFGNKALTAINDGCYILTIKTVEALPLTEGVALAYRFTFDTTEEVPFNVRTAIFIRPENDGSNGGKPSKGNAFIMWEWTTAAGVKVGGDNTFNPQHFVGKQVMVYMYKAQTGYMEVFGRVFPPEKTDEACQALVALFNAELQRGYIKVYNPAIGSVPKGTSVQPRKNYADSIGMKDDGPERGDDDDDDDDIPY